jgi:DNA-binding transcriptional LysR family regulator
VLAPAWSFILRRSALIGNGEITVQLALASTIIECNCGPVTLTQLGAFVLVARLGSVRAAAEVLGVSEPAVSKAIAALRVHLGDQLVVREGNGMAVTDGGSRLLAIASQMVSLGAEAEAAVRAARGAPARLRLAVDPTVAEFIATPLLEAFHKRWNSSIETIAGVATAAEMRVLLSNRLADLALGPDLSVESADPLLLSEPVLRLLTVLVSKPEARFGGSPHHWPWLVGPGGADPTSDVGRLLETFRVPEHRIQVFPNDTAAWAAAADGNGVAPAIASLVAPQIRRGELQVVPTEWTPVGGSWYATTLKSDRRSVAATFLRNFLNTPDAMQLMCSPGAGVPPSRFRPPVYVTIWS